MSRYKVLDSHVHLCPLKNTSYLESVGPGHILYRNHTPAEYLKYNTSEKVDRQGVVVIEMAVKSSPDDEDGWKNPLKEYDYHAKIIDEGIDGAPEGFIKGLVPWAPIPAGYDAVAKYVSELKSRSSSTAFQHVKGFRYVIQDKPSGTGLAPGFLEGLRYLDEHGYVFDLGVDLEDGGFYQFKESIELLKKFPRTKFIINHLTKPDFYVNQPNEEFNEWVYYMTKISEIGNNYIKLSGCFEKLPPGYVAENGVKDIAAKISNWFNAILELYGTKKIIFGSNWPMDNTNGDTFDEHAYSKWVDVVLALLDQNHLSDAEKQDIFFNNCIDAYNL